MKVFSFSFVRRDFACNVGIQFQTPEEFFLDQPPEPFVRKFDPATYLEDKDERSKLDYTQPACTFEIWHGCFPGRPTVHAIWRCCCRSEQEPDELGNAASVPFSKQHPLELVIFCGSPGAGKSTFYWDQLEALGYERVNQDILKSVRTPASPCRIFLVSVRS